MSPRSRAAPWLFLDLGNVVLDIDKKRAGALFSSLTGLAFDEFDWIFFGSGLLDDFNIGRISEKAFVLRVQGDLRYHKASLTEAQVRQVWTSILVPVDGTIEWLLEIEAQFEGVWVVSDINPIHWRVARDWLLKTGLGRLKGATLSYELGLTKPSAKVYEDALLRSTASPGDALFVDDRAINIEGAERLGIYGVQFAGASQARKAAERWLKGRR